MKLLAEIVTKSGRFRNILLLGEVLALLHLQEAYTLRIFGVAKQLHRNQIKDDVKGKD